MQAHDSETAAPAANEPRPRFSSDGTAFLDQGKAQNTLRHELQALFDAIETRMNAPGADEDTIVEVSSQPNRIVARRGTRAISFSWLTGRLGGVSDGHLLVLEWTGIPANQRGVAALKSGTLSREASYRPEATDAASWCWRDGKEKGGACTTQELLGEWFDEANHT
jgi:hypothetical protein